MTERLAHLAVQADRHTGDFEAFLDRCVECGVHYIDLSDGVDGAPLLELSDADAKRVRKAMKKRGIKVYCLDTGLFSGSIDVEEADFRTDNFGPLPRALELASVFKPMLVALGSVTTEARPAHSDINEYIDQEAGWVFQAYADAIDMIAGHTAAFIPSGPCAAIVNAPEGILVSPDETLRFLDIVNRADETVICWDVQATARSGVEPTAELTSAFASVLGYTRLRGGRPANGDCAPPWQPATLAETPWPAAEIAQSIVDSGLSPVICLGASQGAGTDSADFVSMAKDIEFLNEIIVIPDEAPASVQ